VTRFCGQNAPKFGRICVFFSWSSFCSWGAYGDTKQPVKSQIETTAVDCRASSVRAHTSSTTRLWVRVRPLTAFDRTATFPCSARCWSRLCRRAATAADLRTAPRWIESVQPQRRGLPLRLPQSPPLTRRIVTRRTARNGKDSLRIYSGFTMHVGKLTAWLGCKLPGICCGALRWQCLQR